MSEFQPNIIRLDSIGSTNDYLLELAKSNDVAPFTVVCTPHQTHGKGQRGRTWESTPGDQVTLSMLVNSIHPSLDQGFGLSMLSALAIMDALQPLELPQVQIKWPNDIYIQSRKCAGILIERIWTGQRLQCSVIGIGINVQNRPRELAQAISLSEVSQHKLDTAQIESLLIHHLIARLSTWIQTPENVIRNEYHRYLLGRNELLTFESHGAVFSGVIQEINTLGQLIIRDESGEFRHFLPTEITFVL
ncbi:MAG: biotin--[acetyl-CoA-carboxylase] ligase [Flavobacteriales bacterium]